MLSVWNEYFYAKSVEKLLTHLNILVNKPHNEVKCSESNAHNQSAIIRSLFFSTLKWILESCIFTRYKDESACVILCLLSFTTSKMCCRFISSISVPETPWFRPKCKASTTLLRRSVSHIFFCRSSVYNGYWRTLLMSETVTALLLLICNMLRRWKSFLKLFCCMCLLLSCRNKSVQFCHQPLMFLNVYM